MALRLNIPPVTRVLLVLTIAISVLYNIAHWTGTIETPADGSYGPARRPQVPYLALVPSKILYYPWTLITTTFVEQNIVNFIVNGATILFGGRYFERAWGSRSFAITLLITSLIPNILSVPVYIIWGSITGHPIRSQTPVTGGITIQAVFLVAFKQLVPEHTVSIYRGMIKMRVKHFPAVFLLVNTLSGLILGTDTALIHAWLGLLTSWTYLRFYKRQPDIAGTGTDTQGAKGDASETFAFATFFPDVVQPPIAAFCDQIFALLCAAKVCTPFSDEAVAASNEQAAARGDAGLPTFIKQSRGLKGMSKREEAERRRALAMRALDQRLNAATSSRPQPAPTTVTPNVSSDQEALGQTDYRPDDN